MSTKTPRAPVSEAALRRLQGVINMAADPGVTEPEREVARQRLAELRAKYGDDLEAALASSKEKSVALVCKLYWERSVALHVATFLGLAVEDASRGRVKLVGPAMLTDVARSIYNQQRETLHAGIEWYIAGYFTGAMPGVLYDAPAAPPPSTGTAPPDARAPASSMPLARQEVLPSPAERAQLQREWTLYNATQEAGASLGRLHRPAKPQATVAPSHRLEDRTRREAPPPPSPQNPTGGYGLRGFGFDPFRPRRG